MYKRLRLATILLTIASLSLAGSLALAQGKGKGPADEPPGQQKEKKKEKTRESLHRAEKEDTWLPPGLSKEEKAEWQGGRPPGWSRGEKEGWEGGDVPPGLAKKEGKLPPGLAKKVPPGWGKWSDKKKKQWDEDLKRARTRVRRTAKKAKDFGKDDLESALLSLEAAARTGVPVEHVSSFVEEAIEKGVKGNGLETATRAMAYGVDKETDFDGLSQFARKKLDDGVTDDELAIEIYKEVAGRHEEPQPTKVILEEKQETKEQPK